MKARTWVGVVAQQVRSLLGILASYFSGPRIECFNSNPASCYEAADDGLSVRNQQPTTSGMDMGKVEMEDRQRDEGIPILRKLYYEK